VASINDVQRLNLGLDALARAKAPPETPSKP
jgi:hypothetical protein